MSCCLLRKGMMPIGTIVRGLIYLSLLVFIFLIDSDSLSAQSVLVGNQSIESNIDSNATGLAEAFPVTASASGQVGSINFFLDPASAATKIYLGIYANSNGHPGSLLTQGSITQFARGTWNSVPVSPVNLTSGTAYWIAILGTTGGIPVFRDRSTTACHSQTSSQSNLTSLPATWSTGQTWNTCYISAYAVSNTLAATVMIGNQAVEASLDKNPAGRAEAFPAVANTSGTVGTIALYLDPTSGSGPVFVGLYADNNGHPGTLLGQGSTPQPVAGNWNQISIASSSITAGHQYWIAVLGTSATSPYFRDRQTSNCHSETTPQTTLTSLPATWSTGSTWATCYISAYGLPATSSPVLTISSANLSFATTQGGANPAPANFSVTNAGTGGLSFTVSTDAAWLSATPASGTAPQTVQVSVSVGSLAPGAYTGHVTVTAAGAQGSPAVATVTFTVAPFVPPSIAASASPSANANGWNNSNVTVTFSCAPGSYPLASCTAPAVVSTEGANQSICGAAVDSSGFSSTACATVSIDKTQPKITAVVTPTPTNGVNYGGATVTFTCTDVLSGVATCASPVADTTVGAGQLISGTVTDKAGNSNSASVTLNIQPAVPPTITASVSPSANANGWNNSNVTVTFVCTAGSYPIQTCPSPVVVSTEGANQSISGTVTDTNGKTAIASATVNLDKTPPTITAVVTPTPTSGVSYGSATVTFTCTDSLSGVATCPSPVTDTTVGAGQLISGTVTDKAGNSNSVGVTLNIQPAVPPTITASVSPSANANGWNNSNVTVTFVCTAGSYPIQTCPSPVVVSTEGANQSISGTVTDTNGKTATASATVNLDKTPPTITATISPAPNANWVNTTIPVTITFTCSDALSGIVVCPGPIGVTTTGSNQVFGGTATDKAGNSAPANVTLNIQTTAPTPPSIAASISPTPNANGWDNSPVTVSFACASGTNPVATCPAPVMVSTEGVNQSICGRAIDTTGLSATACANVNLDRTPPTISATASPSPLANTWNTTPVTVTFACADSLSGVAICPTSQTISTDGFHQAVTGTATDVAGNVSALAQVTLNIDQTPPSILLFTAPTQLAPGQSGTATVNTTDNIGVAAVVIQLNGATVATLATAPYSTTFTAPTSANAGDTLTLTASVFDLAGNVNSSARGIQIVPAGVVTGQVLSDATGLPFTGATVQVLGASAQDTSDNSGRYSIASNSAHLFLSISSTANATTGAPAMVTVDREVFLQAGVGTVPVDARMTQIAAAIPVNSAGGSLMNGSITVSIAPGAVSSVTNFHLTSLSQQGLPGLLPLGWSPIAAFDIRADTSISASFTASLTQLPNSVVFHLARYDYSSHTWLMVMPNLGAANGTLTIPVPSVGDYALATPDSGNTSLNVPSAGQALMGLSMVALPAGAAATGALNPPSVSPTGGTSSATLTLQSSVPLPSGTVIQAKVQDTYSLVSGKQLSQAPRLEDIIVYQFAAPTGAAAAATFPVTPAQTFQPGKLASGDVHLDILSGRESVRGQVGGSDSASVTGGDATLTIAAGSLPQDTAISVAPESVDTFLPSTSALLPLAEYNIDLSGQTLLSAAQLSVASGSSKPGDNLVLAQIQRIQGVPYLVVVSLAQVSGSNLVTQAAPGLPGITQGGDYVFYKLTSPAGYVSGTVSTSTGPVPSLVQTDGLPFVAFSSSAGSYVIVALAGPVNLSASIPNTAVAGATAAQVTAGQTATANITLIGQTESATITPPNGAVGVPLTAEIDITAPDAFNPVSVTASSITLTQNGQGTSTPISVRFVFSQGATRLSVFPFSALQPSTTYTMAASGLANVLGGLVSVPTITFTTQAITPPNFNTDALVFSMPDQNGNVPVSAPPNSFPPGSTILIVDQTNGVVLSLTVGNDGSVSGQFPATIDDVLSVTITAPDKTTATFTRSQFVAPDGTTAVGPGGGTVTGPGSTGLIIPQGALTKGTTFKLTPLDQTAFPVLPSFPGMIFGSGLHVDAPAMPIFSQEVKIAFPVPANAPSNAVYYVYRRITDQAGNVSFDTIDQAFVRGTGANAQVVTASPPFCGYRNSYGAVQGRTAADVIAAVFQPFVDFILLLEIPVFDANQPGAASQGLIVGKALQIVPPPPGQSSPTFVPVDGAVISFDFDTSRQAITSGSCGTFALFDPIFAGGTRNLTATFNGQKLKTVANEVNTFAMSGAQDAQFGPFGINAGTERQYKNIGVVSFTFAAPNPPPPPPQISIGVFTLDNNNNRQPISGIVTTGTSLVLTFVSSSSIQVVSASIDGSPFSTVIADKVPNPNPAFGYYTLSDQYVAPAPGLHTIVASAINPLSPNNAPITETRGFLVVQAGGSNTVTTTDPPGVISSDPQNNAQNVDPTSTTPSLTFSEPVTNVTGNVTMTGLNSGDPAHIQLAGFKTDGTIANPVQPTDKITSLTILHDGLQYGDVYTITLSNAIVDLNGKPLAPPYKIVFNTYAPTQTGSAQSNNLLLTRPAIIGDRAYFGGMLPGPSGPVIGGPDVVDISDPSKPKDLGIPTSFVGRVTDAAGQEKSPVTPGSLLAISASFAIDNFIPSNIWLYQVPSADLCPVSQAPPACPSPLRIGAVSASSSATQAGTALRLAIKDRFLYSSTSLQGLQVIDLQQVLDDYTAATPSDFGQMVSTEGQGFAMDAIVNTIRIPTTTGGTFTMFGLQAGDFLLGNSGGSGAAPSQTLLVATGGLPLVVADPFKSGPAAVLYPPQDPAFTNGGLSNVPLIFTTPDGLTTYQLSYGAATALGTITTNTGGISTSRTVAVVVGTGSSSASGPGSFLAVVDMSQPYVPGAQLPYVPGSPYLPKPIGFLKLSKGPTDVLLYGNYAAVGTGTDVLLVDLADPTNPRSAGTITGSFGNKLGLTAQGILVASGTIPGSPSPSTVQTASLGPYVRPDDLTPIFAKIAVGDPFDPPNSQTYQLLSDVTITVSLHPANLPVTTGTLFLSGNNFSQALPLQFNSTTGQALVKLAKGTSLPPLLNARPSVVSRDHINAYPNQYTAGTASFLLDLDNNTRLDAQKDRPNKNPGGKFGFWEADSTNAGTQEGLTDFAQIQLKIDALPSADQGKLYLQLQGNAQTPVWTLTNNVSVPIDADDPTLSSNQKKYLSSDSSQPNSPSPQLKLLQGSPVDCSSATTNDPTSTLCQSDNTGSIEITNLAPGHKYTLLFSCQSCKTDPTRVFQLAVVGGTVANQSFSALAQPGVVEKQLVDIRPIKNWVGIYSARVPSFLIDGDPPTQPVPEDGWANQIPANANVTVLVHGFTVTDSYFQTVNVPRWTKRFYWTEHPMLPFQKTADGKIAYTFGFSWSGDSSLLGNRPATLQALYLPQDAFVALESASTFANFLQLINPSGGHTNTVNVFAHSLGNMVVNQGLTRVSDGTVTNYVMNEAAVPAEAFFTSESQYGIEEIDGGDPVTAPSPLNSTRAYTDPFFAPYRKQFRDAHLQQMGFFGPSSDTDAILSALPTGAPNTDKIWVDLQQVVTSPGELNNSDLFPPGAIYQGFYLLTQEEVLNPASDAAGQAAQSDYTHRWRYNPSASNSGPWQGFFAKNLQLQNTKIISSVNNGDCALVDAWMLNQLIQEPDRDAISSINDLSLAYSNLQANANPFPPGRVDNLTNQAWLGVFEKFASRVDLYGGDVSTLRRWNRLATWYPSRSGPVGSFAYANTLQSPNFSDLDFTKIVQNHSPCSASSGPTSMLLSGLPQNRDTHSYMTDQPLPTVWKAYKLIQHKLYPNSDSDPDPPQP